MKYLFFLLVIVSSSCNVIKAKRSTKQTSDSVSIGTKTSIDTSFGGSTSKTKTDSKETFDWSKLTIQYPRDTNVTNIYNYPQRPATVIYETGKATKDVQEQKSDSNWYKNFLIQMDEKYDARFSSIEETIKNKETKPNIWFYVIIGGCVLLAWEVIKYGWKWLTSKYTFFLPKTKA